MRSHVYRFSFRDLVRAISAPALGLTLLAVVVHVGNGLGLMPPARPSDNPEQTLLAFKAGLSRSKHPADVVLVGDSSCGCDVDAPLLSALMPNQPTVLNLGLIIGLGLNTYGEALSDFLRSNPNQVRQVVLLVTPEMLTDKDTNEAYQQMWHQLRGDGARRDSRTTVGVGSLLGLPVLRTQVLPRLLNTPFTGKGAGFYGFCSDFESYLAVHQGSMIDPSLFSPQRHPATLKFYLSDSLEGPSRRFRQLVTSPIKLAVGLTPIPMSLAVPDYQQKRDQLLHRWNDWLGAEQILTNCPSILPDHLFATPAHLNQAGQRRFTASAAAALAGTRNLPLSECQEREGLKNTFAKLATSNTVRIAYLGGSITAQEGWRPQTLQWFRDQFPSVKVEEINAAIGGTGSDLGVFRLKHDVLDHEPDLLFVEFAVNDGAAPSVQIHRCMEGIVRQTWKHNPSTDICFVYTLAGDMLDTLKQEKLPRSIAAMEHVADHYGIPTINLGLEVARMEKGGKLVFQGGLPVTGAEKAALGDRIVFSPDGIHPYPETGHQIYCAAVVRSMKVFRAAGKQGPHLIPGPLRPDNWEAARIVPLDQAKLSKGWERLDPGKDIIAQRFKSRLPQIWKAAKPGESISFQFRGSTAMIYDLIGPDCGQIIVKVDNQKPIVKPRFDAFGMYHHLAMLSVAEELPDTVHRVELTIHKLQPDKARILRQRNETIEDPRRYDGNMWYAGAILLVGEWVP